MIVVTGAAGFIASQLVKKLNDLRYTDIVLVDDFDRKDKEPNWVSLVYKYKVDRAMFFDWLTEHATQVQFIFHLGARTDTTEMDSEIFQKLNVSYSKNIWNACVQYAIPLVYASSAATYGDGGLGYKDDEQQITQLKPLNPYGDSKNEFDIWVLKQEKKPFFWAGLKFFNVYGPGESHKGRMASVVYHAFQQIQAGGEVKLFKSHRPEYKDGEQLRDFIFVEDVVNICVFLMQTRRSPGIYNVGTGKARSFIDLVRAVFTSMNKKEEVQFVDIPLDIRDKYQYYTQADTLKLKTIGYQEPFYSLEQGIEKYIRTLLSQQV